MSSPGAPRRTGGRATWLKGSCPWLLSFLPCGGAAHLVACLPLATGRVLVPLLGREVAVEQSPALDRLCASPRSYCLAMGVIGGVALGGDGGPIGPLIVPAKHRLLIENVLGRAHAANAD